MLSNIPSTMDAMLNRKALRACFLPTLNFPALKLDLAYKREQIKAIFTYFISWILLYGEHAYQHTTD